MELYSHQIAALRKIKSLENDGPLKGSILWFKMGTGKTVIALRSILDSGLKSNLVVVPKTVLVVWEKERLKFFPELKCFIYHKDFTAKKLTTEIIESNHLILTTYDVIVAHDKKFSKSDSVIVKCSAGKRKDKILCYKQSKISEVCPDPLLYHSWNKIILDEAHKIKNHSTRVFRAVLSLCKVSGMCLSGNPIRNKNSDLWPLLFFCGMTVPSNPNFYNKSHYEKYKNVIVHAEVDLSLPPLNIVTVKVALNSDERIIYENKRRESRTIYNKFRGKVFGDFLATLCHLRQCSVSAHLMSDFPGESCKTKKIKEIIDRHGEKEKFVVVSSFTTYLKYLRKVLSNFNCGIICGSMTVQERGKCIDDFSGEMKILLCNSVVGSEGIDLTVASKIIIVEPWWNMSHEEQSTARCHRNGQTKSVTCYRLLAENTIEETMLEMCANKKELGKNHLKRCNKLTDETLRKIIGSDD